MTRTETQTILKKLSAIFLMGFHLEADTVDTWHPTLKKLSKQDAERTVDAYSEDIYPPRCPAEFMQKAYQVSRQTIRRKKEDLEQKFRREPGLEPFILQEFQTYLMTQPQDQQRRILDRLRACSPVLYDQSGSWFDWPVLRLEAALILKEAQEAGRWTFDKVAFDAFKATRKQRSPQEVRKILPFQAVKKEKIG